MRTYQEFLEGKMLRAPESGFDPGDDVSDVLFPFQRDIVRWALRGAGGRYSPRSASASR